MQSHGTDSRTEEPDRAVFAAAGEILDRLDDLYDERPDAFAKLLEAIDAYLPALTGHALGDVARVARSRIVDLRASSIAPTALIRGALEVTDELRLLCASLWGEGDAGIS